MVAMGVITQFCVMPYSGAEKREYHYWAIPSWKNCKEKTTHQFTAESLIMLMMNVIYCLVESQIW